MFSTALKRIRQFGSRSARPAVRTFSPRLEGLEAREVMTTAGWVNGVPPRVMAFTTRLQTSLDQVSASRTIGSLTIKDNVTRAVTFTAPTTGDYVIRTGQAAGHATLDTVLGVYDARGVRLAYNDDAAGTRFSALHVTLQAGRTYQVGVGHYRGDHPTDTLSRFCSLTIDGRNDDRFEAQGGDTFGTAVTLPTTAGLTTVSGLALVDTGDYFRFHLPEAAGANDAASIAFQNAGGNLDLTLFDAAGTVRGTSAGATNGERVSLAGLPAGDYVVKVAGTNGAINPQYTLSLFHQATTPPPPAPAVDLGQQVVTWAKNHLGQQVGDGECATLVDTALKAVGAKSFAQLGPTGADADYVWGTPVLTFHAGDAVSLLNQLRPGDIIQFRNVTIHTNVPGGWFESNFPHHTAIVETNSGGGTLHLLESNLNGVRTVAQTVRPFADMTQGTIWVYRPTAS